MRVVPKTPESRREFFGAAARYGLLTIMGAVASLAARKPGLANQTCVNRGICGGCIQFPECGLPQALSAKARRGAHL
jgi:hypothetical protein